MRPIIITFMKNKILKTKLQPESPCIVHVLGWKNLRVHVQCSYMYDDDNKNVRLKKYFYFSYTYMLKVDSEIKIKILHYIAKTW